MTDIKVTTATYNEIVQTLTNNGRIFKPGDPIVIQKDERLLPPVDYKLATVRRDCADICAKVYNSSHMEKGITFIEFCNVLYQFVLNDKLPVNKQSLISYTSDDPVNVEEPLQSKQAWR
jgi:hypothetical protein